VSQLPISVVIPHLASRKAFLEAVVLPAVQRNRPAEVFVMPGDTVGPQVARNNGAAQATQPYVIFIDDDSVPEEGAFAKYVAALEKRPECAFAYCDVVLHRERGEVRTHYAQEFDLEELRRRSYVSCLSLVRRTALVPWDPQITRMQDWDFWLTITSNGGKGVYVPEPLFRDYRIDASITCRMPLEPNVARIRQKHNLPPTGAYW